MSTPSTSLDERVRRYVRRLALIPEGAGVLVGVSGGVDSVVLLRVLHRLGYRVEAAHVNYGLRGEASDADEAFAAGLCERLGLPLHRTAFDTHADSRARGRSLQAVARELRYDWFAELAGARGLGFVAVGHHQDDQAETVLLNLVRGAGPEGLAGMRPSRRLKPGSDVRLVRPLLGLRRAEIVAWAEAEGLGWREDASNEAAKYRRGVLRSEVLPLLEKHFGEGVVCNLARSTGLVRAYVDATLRPALERRFDACAEASATGGRLRLEPLRRQPPVWRHRVLLEALHRWLPGAPRRRSVALALDELLGAQTGRRVTLPQGVVWRARGHLYFEPAGGAPPSEAVPVPFGEDVALPAGTLRVEPLEARPGRLGDGAPWTVVADAERLGSDLVVRPWRDGDRFRPLGMEGTKKVSDYLTDARVPPYDRAGVLVLVAAGRIVWVVGHRLAEDVKVRPETRRLAKMTFARGGAGRVLPNERLVS